MPSVQGAFMGDSLKLIKKRPTFQRAAARVRIYQTAQVFKTHSPNISVRHLRSLECLFNIF
jgi:hypothetical protein